jgi:hypothetical protein
MWTAFDLESKGHSSARQTSGTYGIHAALSLLGLTVRENDIFRIVVREVRSFESLDPDERALLKGDEFFAIAEERGIDLEALASHPRSLSGTLAVYLVAHPESDSWIEYEVVAPRNDDVAVGSEVELVEPGVVLSASGDSAAGLPKLHFAREIRPFDWKEYWQQSEA